MFVTLAGVEWAEAQGKCDEAERGEVERGGAGWAAGAPEALVLRLLLVLLLVLSVGGFTIRLGGNDAAVLEKYECEKSQAKSAKSATRRLPSDLAIFQDAATKTTIGLILPPKSRGSDDAKDVIVKLTTSLPYGYVGFGFSALGKRFPEFGLVGWKLVTVPPRRRALPEMQDNEPISVLPDGLIAQQSILITNASVPSAGQFGNTVVSLSPKSSESYEENQVTFFLRCQQCSATSFDAGDSLTLFRSAASDLPLEDFTVTHFPIKSIDIFRSEQFDFVAKELGI
ncbi:hypothetical protein GALMADRAFT_161146 [Galerina marginata CBS 339.88]|uniref:Cellobiose dehydrogenase cytochrome domain-containing protein n=1 Tax=Galerina marginata (strain CBS 339.88) TaxID=685588 RepID=A0A067SBH3_GALM3|nr:hypothetical protein GALMADRAFT_161146 [Galerina marginata CBS 339.88]